MKNEGTILTVGMAEVSVKEIIALEKSVNDKDQTIGALREQVKGLEAKVEDVKADAIAKQAMVIIQKGSTQKPSSYRCNCGYYYDARYHNHCPSCGERTPMSGETKEYKNLDTVIETIRKEEALKLGINLNELENKLNTLSLDKTKVQNTLNFKIAELEESLKTEKKEKEVEISTAKEKIRKHLGGIVDEQVKQIDELKEEVRKVKKDKTDEFIEEARKQEIIDLKERITELEKPAPAPEFGWFKTIVYNWLDVDGKAKVKAEVEAIEKQARVNEISNDYPKHKSFWAPTWGTTASDSFWWM